MTSIVQNLIRWFDAMFPGNMEPSMQRKDESGEKARDGSVHIAEEAPVPSPVEDDGSLRTIPRHFAPDNRSLATILAGIPKGLRTRDLYARPDLVCGPHFQRARRATAPVARIGMEDEATPAPGHVSGSIDSEHPANPLAVWPHWEDDSLYLPRVSGPDSNPATGLPMVDGAMVDVAGNPYGLDLHHADHGIDVHHHDHGIDLHHHDHGMDLHHQDHSMDLHNGFDTVGHFGFDAFGHGGQGHEW